jgi:thymidine phosphorylase
VDGVVDPAAGIEFLLPAGADVRAGEALLVVSGSDQRRVDKSQALLQAAVQVADGAPALEPLIRETLGASDT